MQSLTASIMSTLAVCVARASAEKSRRTFLTIGPNVALSFDQKVRQAPGGGENLLILEVSGRSMDLLRPASIE